MRKRICNMIIIFFVIRLGCSNPICASDIQYTQNHLNDITVSSVKDHKESKWKKFWKSDSKVKLWCGIILAAAGVSMAGYGFSTHTVTKYEDRVVIVTENIPSNIESVSNNFSYTYDNTGGLFVYYDTVRATGKVRNKNSYTAKNVIIKLEFSMLSQPSIFNINYGSNQAAVGSIAPNMTEDYDLFVNITPNQISGYSLLYFTNAEYTYPAVRSFKTESEEANSKPLGYVGVAAAVTGLSFIVSYGISMFKGYHNAKNIDVEPVLYASRDNNYQGIKLSYRF